MRLRTSLYIESQGEHILIDPGPDFRTQCLQHHITQIDTFLITHPHHDHIGGLDDTRAIYYAMNKKPLQLFAETFTLDGIYHHYDYLFPRHGNSQYHGAPQAQLNEIMVYKHFKSQNNTILPLRVWHGDMPVTGFRIGHLVYLTDVKTVPDETIKNIKSTDILILGVLQREPHNLHFNLNEALEFINKTKAKITYLTHIGHRMGKHAILKKELPPNVLPAYDGLELKI